MTYGLTIGQLLTGTTGHKGPSEAGIDIRGATLKLLRLPVASAFVWMPTWTLIGAASPGAEEILIRPGVRRMDRRCRR